MHVSVSSLDGRSLGLLADQVAALQRQEGQRQLNPQGPLWLPVLDHPGYDVSDDGQVRSWWKLNAPDEPLDEPRLLIKTYDTKGYLWYVLHRFMKLDGVPAHHQPAALPPAVNPLRAWAIVRTRHRAHRLVLSSFIRRPEPGEVAKFIDENNTNITVDNLRWGRPQEAFG